MGMFTSVMTPEGWEIQIYTGRDNCDRYRVGDAVDWWINPDEPVSGRCLDGAYHGEAFKRVNGRNMCNGHFWVVIKDHVVVAVEPCAMNDLNDDRLIEAEGLFKGGLDAQEAHVEARYGIQPLPLDTWSEAAWARKAKRDEEARRLQRQWDAEEYGLSPGEKTACQVGRFTRSKMQEESFYRKLMAPEVTP